MRARVASVLLAVCMAGALLMGSGSPPLVQDRYHDDQRSTPKLLFHPAYFSKAGQVSKDTAYAYLAANAGLFQLPADLSNLQLREVKESLLGRHFFFQQHLNGIPVDKAEIIVSVAWDGRVRQVFNNTYPQSCAKRIPSARLEGEQALDIAWQHLRVHGELIDPPKAELVYIPEGTGFRLVFRTQTDVEAPFGYWAHRIDAVTGEVLSVRETSIDSQPQPKEEKGFDRYSGPVLDRAAAVEACRARAAQRDAQGKTEAVLASGTAKVFDPEPKSTLNDDSLLDTSPPSAFSGAYFIRNLVDITFSGGSYSLVGPWVRIIDFESPATAPSTSATGNWTAERGVNAFNDVMTYYHIDTNQRYIQSLGYTNIQHLSIEADSDGLSGADNSHYVPSTNRIAYGHGGVDDNEDVDVILHEYWHAIQHSINASWGGNDTGAMGEGFGDYWPASHGYELPNGPTFHVDWAFHWDGHNSDWAGRQMDRTTARYDPALTYPAHTVVGGVNGDELWGTPVWQAFQDLRTLGVPRTQIDTIILESNFGLGAGLKMPDMANAIVAACQDLHPEGPHAQKFYDRFVQVNILQTPCQMGPVAEGDNGANGVADPTETISLTVNLRNTGASPMTAVHGTLTSTTPGLTITEEESDYEDIPAGGNRNNLAPYRVQIPYGFPCGTGLAFTLQADYTDTVSRTNNFSFTLPTGILQELSASVSPALAIPDNTPAGVNSTITFSGTGESVAAGFNVDLHITHTYIGDLIVTLTSPDHVTVILHNRSGGTTENIVGNYPGTLTPNQNLGAFTGHPLDGAWTLNVSDHAGVDTGTLHSWGIHNPSGFGTYCEIPGDIDGNALVTMRDAILGLQEINGSDTGIRVNAWADANGDGLITGVEIVFILEYLAGDWIF